MLSYAADRQLSRVLALAVLPLSLVWSASAETRRADHPNIVLIITDDQGYADLGLHGNTKIRTPNLDRLGKESVRFSQFCVSPVCAPTRASLMTGRYNYRTGVVDTYLGRAMMHPDEVTLPEVLSRAGYRTGIFGKWHLGDNYPLRPIDQGFLEALTHNGGGIDQPGDPPGTAGYFDPALIRNGKLVKTKGYCTDVFTDGALEFIEKHRSRPFFAYVATNAPHDPLQVADRYVEPYRKLGLDERTAKIYGMVTNLDENVGRLLEKLRQLNLERDTVVVFMTDNGPAGRRAYNAGLRAQKGSPYEGGIRAPLFIRWPGVLRPGQVVDRLAGHIDLLPTLLDAAGGSPPAGVKVDGKSLMPLLREEREAAAAWPDRTLYFQWHRGDRPEPFRGSAIRGERYKLVEGKELYDLRNDPGETKDLSAQHPEIVTRMRRDYWAWYRDVSSTRGYDPPRIALGTRHEDPVVLSRQDWRGPNAGWTPKSVGHWEVETARSGRYEVTLRLAPNTPAGEAHFRLGPVTAKQPVSAGSATCTFRDLQVPAGPGRLEAWVEAGNSPLGVHYVEVRRQ